MDEITTKSGVVNCGTAERDALVALYNATDGPNWANKTNSTGSATVRSANGTASPSVTADESRRCASPAIG